MSRQILTRAQVRDVDVRALRDYGLPGVVLMENAGRECARLLLELGIDGPVVICTGKGNNGGDGFVIARHLDNAGHDVSVASAVDTDLLEGDAALNHRVLTAAAIPVTVIDETGWGEALAGADWIVDALLGTGLQGTVRDPYTAAIAAINAAKARVLAVDLPSGLDCDAGHPLGTCVRATHTATLVAAKPGFAVDAAGDYTGSVHVLDIGIPRALLDEVLG